MKHTPLFFTADFPYNFIHILKGAQCHMKYPFERFIAWRYIRAPQKEGVVSIIAIFSFLGIMLGVATLIIVTSVMNGFRDELMNRILGFNGHLNVHAFCPEDVDKIRNIPDVVNVNPVMDHQGLCMGKTRTAGALIRALPLEALAKRPLIAEHIVEGNFQDLSKPHHILMGHKLAKKLGLSTGDKIKIMRPDGEDTAFGVMPVTSTFVVAGLFDSGMHEYDQSFIFMSLANGEAFYEKKNTSIFEVFIRNPAEVQIVAQRMHVYGWGVYDWQRSNNHFFNALTIQSNVMFVILTLIIVVAAFNIIACLVMLVKDKTKDVAILKTMGASQHSIMKVFIMIGGFLGGMGTLTGALLGWSVAYHVDTIRRFLENLSGAELFKAEIYFLSQLPVKINYTEIGFIVSLSLTLSFCAALYPAWKASRLDPVKGLRYE